MSSDEFTVDSIINNLATRFIGQRIIYHPRLVSTMDTARQQARKGASEGTVIIAGEQTGGRGRIQRAWMSPKGNIAMSIILYPDISSLHYFIMLVSVAVVRSIEAVTGLKPDIKWPNDILISGKKAGGILIENEVTGSRVDFSVIGIGLNIGLRLADFPEISAIATSLNDETGGNVSPVGVARHLLEEIEKLYLILPDGEYIYEEWRDKLITLGQRVRVEYGGSTVEGIAESVDTSGALMLRRADGSLDRIVAGDVTRVRNNQK